VSRSDRTRASSGLAVELAVGRENKPRRLEGQGTKSMLQSGSRQTVLGLIAGREQGTARMPPSQTVTMRCCEGAWCINPPFWQEKLRCRKGNDDGLLRQLQAVS
jgi:hypothetical protein